MDVWRLCFETVICQLSYIPVGATTYAYLIITCQYAGITWLCRSVTCLYQETEIYCKINCKI